MLFFIRSGAAWRLLPHDLPPWQTIYYYLRRWQRADIQDRDGAKVVLKRSRAPYPFVTHAFADGGYAGRLVDWASQKTHITLQIIRRNASTKGFKVLPGRWVVERTFAGIIKNRRLVRNYEQLTTVAETLIIIAATATLIRRWP